MKSLLESLLFLTHADQGELPLNKVDADVDEILQDVIQSAQSSRVKFLSDGAFTMNGDITALKKMFAAILDNALKYSEDEVIVELKIFNGGATVNFIDKGIGISPDDTKKVFDRFFRADKVRTKSDADKSVGLGLSIAKWIADSHGIAIDI
ncbi:MAG: HAMP domain-containing histidine kinase, partial [Selenomonadaceae bacterium]|nr:HAMP domain-containing histidine kinase [Selenomonadaceae bacterium]